MVWGCPFVPGAALRPDIPVGGLASRRNFNIFLVMGLARGMRRVRGAAGAMAPTWLAASKTLGTLANERGWARIQLRVRVAC